MADPHDLVTCRSVPPQAQLLNLNAILGMQGAATPRPASSRRVARVPARLLQRLKSAQSRSLRSAPGRAAEVWGAVEASLQRRVRPLTIGQRCADWFALRRFHLTGTTGSKVLGKLRTRNRARVAERDLLAKLVAAGHMTPGFVLRDGVPHAVVEKLAAARRHVQELEVAVWQCMVDSWFDCSRRSNENMRLGQVRAPPSPLSL